MPGPWEPSLVQGARKLTQPDYYERMANRYGPAFRLRIPYWGDMAMFTTSSAAYQILKLPRNVAHSGMDARRELPRRMLQEALGMGPDVLLMLNEAEHQRMRKLLMPALSNRLSQWEEFIERRTRQEIDEWPLGQPISIRPIAERIALHVIVKIVFGMSDSAEALELRTLLPVLLSGNVGTALSLVSPFGKLDLGGWSPLGRFQRKRNRIDELLYSEIASRRRQLDEGRSDLLSALLVARDDDGNGLTDTEVRDQLVLMAVTGYTSPATAIAWAVERLTRNAAVLERLLTSLDEGDTTYLDAVIRETLRSRPLANDFTRVLAQDAEVDGWALPAGTGVGVAVSVLHYDPALYPDPEVFRPERFLDGNEPDPSAWLPFGGGARRCPGANLAMMEMRVILATMLRAVRLAPDRPEPEKRTAHHITVVPERDGRVIVTERRAA